MWRKYQNNKWGIKMWLPFQITDNLTLSDTQPPLLSCTMLIIKCHGKGSLQLQAMWDHEIENSIPLSRDFLDIVIFSLLPILEHSMKYLSFMYGREVSTWLPCFLSTRRGIKAIDLLIFFVYLLPSLVNLISM